MKQLEGIMADYEYLLKHARRIFPRYRTREAAARQAASDTVVLERHLSREERRELVKRLTEDLLEKK